MTSSPVATVLSPEYALVGETAICSVHLAAEARQHKTACKSCATNRAENIFVLSDEDGRKQKPGLPIRPNNVS